MNLDVTLNVTSQNSFGANRRSRADILIESTNQLRLSDAPPQRPIPTVIFRYNFTYEPPFCSLLRLTVAEFHSMFDVLINLSRSVAQVTEVRRVRLMWLIVYIP